MNEHEVEELYLQIERIVDRFGLFVLLSCIADTCWNTRECQVIEPSCSHGGCRLRSRLERLLNEALSNLSTDDCKKFVPQIFPDHFMPEQSANDDGSVAFEALSAK